MSLDACIKMLADDHPPPVVAVSARARMRLQDGRQRFLDLKEQGILAVAGVQEHDVASSADAADADHFQGNVDEAIAFDQGAAVVGERVVVSAEDPAQPLADALLVDVTNQRRRLDDPQVPVDHARQLGEGLQTGPTASLAPGLSPAPCASCG